MTSYKEFGREIIHEKFRILTDNFNDNPRRSIVYTFHPADEVHAYHKHRFFEINFILSGSGINKVNGEQIIMHKGDAILMHPDTFHRLYIDENSVAVNLLIYPPFLLSNLQSAHPDSALGKFLSSSENSDHNYYILFSGGSDDTSCAERLIDKIRENIESGVDNLFAEEGLFLLLFSHLLENKTEIRLSSRRGKDSERFQEKLMDYTISNYNTVSLEILSQKFNYSRSHICRVFKHYTGVTCTEFINELRLSKASEMLTYYNYGISEIAEKIGYQSIEHFYRLFKKKYGISPLQYRKANKKPIKNTDG